MAWRAWLPGVALRWWQSILLGVALAGAAAAIGVALHGPLGRDLPFITYFPALIVASALGGWIGGLACLAVATIAAVLLVLPAQLSAAWALGSFWTAALVVIAVAAALADSVRELRLSRGKLADAQAQLQTLVGELAHRNRNALFVIMSIVSQSARGAASVEAAEQLINARLSALLRAQEVIVHSDGASASLQPLIERALEPFGLERFEIAPGPEVPLEADVALGLGLLFHELATNAVKYGALSLPTGRIQVRWSLEGRLAQFTWREVGGPAVAEPSTKGFGSRLLDFALVPQGGKAERRFEPDGLICELHIPIPPEASTPAHASQTSPGARFAGELAPSVEG